MLEYCLFWFWFVNRWYLHWKTLLSTQAFRSSIHKGLRLKQLCRHESYTRSVSKMLHAVCVLRPLWCRHFPIERKKPGGHCFKLLITHCPDNKRFYLLLTILCVTRTYFTFWLRVATSVCNKAESFQLFQH